jgi:ACS family allantoate permease-like MFS transporter
MLPEKNVNMYTSSQQPGVDCDGQIKESTRVSTRQRYVDKEDADDTTVFYNTHKDSVRPLTPEIERKLVRKNFWFLLLQTWWISFLIHLDKSTLSSASTMGIFQDVDMTKNQYNQLFTLFYAGYLIALWPGAWIAQRIGHKQFICGSLFLWALLIGVHPAVKTGKEMMAVRFLLGMVSLLINQEASVILTTGL